jgi:hypothetical protein
MKKDTRSKVLWTVWMAGGGLLTAAIVYLLTGDAFWTAMAVLCSGVVLNAIGQMVTRPISAVKGTRERGRPAPS